MIGWRKEQRFKRVFAASRAYCCAAENVMRIDRENEASCHGSGVGEVATGSAAVVQL